MSQSPLSYHSPNVNPQGPQKPTFLIVMAILGIVFGGLGVLCIGGGELFTLAALASPKFSPVIAAQPVAQKVVNIVLGLLGLVMCGVLLWGSIGAINLKPAARRLMVGWAVADIILDLVRLIIGLVVLGLMSPAAQNAAFQQNRAFANNPNAAQFMTYAKIIGVVSVLVWWALGTTFGVLVYVCYRNAKVVAAFDPPLPPSAPLPPPPL